MADLLRRFLVVTVEHGRDNLAVFHDELPKRSMLAAPIAYKLELLGRWRTASLTEIGLAYVEHKARGTLPPDNTDPRKRPKVRAAMGGVVIDLPRRAGE